MQVLVVPFNTRNYPVVTAMIAVGILFPGLASTLATLVLIRTFYNRLQEYRKKRLSSDVIISAKYELKKAEEGKKRAHSLRASIDYETPFD